MNSAQELERIVADWDCRTYDDTWDERDVITYAIASGAGLDNVGLLWEQGPLQVLPSFASRLGGRAVLDFFDLVAHLGLASFASRIDVEVHRSIPPHGRAISRTTAHLVDSAPGRVVVGLVAETMSGGEPLSTATTHVHFRLPHDGPRDARAEKPEPQWLHQVVDTIRPHQGAAFRLLLDVTDGRDLQDGLHIDPATSRRMGLGEPLLQGEATLAVACRHAMRELAGHDAARISSISARLSGRVGLDDELTLRFTAPTDGIASFAGWNADGRRVVEDGLVGVLPSSAVATTA